MIRKEYDENKEEGMGKSRLDVERIKFGGYSECNNESEVELVWKSERWTKKLM